MLLRVLRTEKEKSTIGVLYIDGKQECFTLEDKCRAENEKKIYGETAIPYGKYEITFRKEGTIYEDYKVRFADIGNERGTLWVRNVPGFDYILIHVGNYCKDTKGCLLVGKRVVSDVEIAESTKAYKFLYIKVADALEKGEKVFIEYVRA